MNNIKSFDESGWFLYNNRITMQNRNFEGPMSEFFNMHRGLRVIEIGAAYGGFTSFLVKLRQEGLIKSLNIIDLYERPELLELVDLHHIPFYRVDAHHRDCFLYVKSVIGQQETPVVIFCDGGSKIYEFNMYATVLKSGDYIFAHDYAPNKEYFENNMKDKIWNWHEIQDSDIEEVSKQCGLEQQYKQSFLDIAWVCKKKI